MVVKMTEQIKAKQLRDRHKLTLQSYAHLPVNKSL